MKIHRKQLTDFKNRKTQTNKSFYDLEYDKVLIEQSIAKQYGVLPSRQEEMKYSDWAKLLSGIMHDTPLGQVVAIRRETDQKIIKNYNADQMKIRRDWQKFCLEHRPPTPEEEKQMYVRLENTLNSLFGKRKEG